MQKHNHSSHPHHFLHLNAFIVRPSKREREKENGGSRKVKEENKKKSNESLAIS